MPDSSPVKEQAHPPELIQHQPAQPEITRWLHEWQQGDHEAGEKLFRATYDELRRMAQRLLYGARQRQAMQTGTLVHELFMRLAGVAELQAESRAAFFVYAAKTMERLIIDSVRQQFRAKHGSGAEHLPLNEQLLDLNGLSEARCLEWLAFDRALGALRKHSDECAKVILLRRYLKLTIEETSDVLNLSPATIKRRDHYAYAWLSRQMNKEQGGSDEPSKH